MDTIFLLIGIGVVIGFAAGMLYGYERAREDNIFANFLKKETRAQNDEVPLPPGIKRDQPTRVA